MQLLVMTLKNPSTKHYDYIETKRIPGENTKSIRKPRKERPEGNITDYII